MDSDKMLADALSREHRDHAESVRAFEASRRLNPGDHRDRPFYGLGTFLGCLVSIAMWVGIAYVILHFVVKYW